MFNSSRKINSVISISVNENIELIMKQGNKVYLNESLCPIDKIFSASIYKGCALIITENEQILTDMEFGKVAVFGPHDLLFDCELISRETNYLENGEITCNWHRIDFASWKVENTKLFSSEYYMPIFALNNLFVFWGYNERLLVCYDNKMNILWKLAGSDFGTYYSGAIEREDKIVNYAGNFKDHLLFSLESGGTLILNAANGNLIKHWPNTFVTHNLRPTLHSAVFWGISYMTFIEVDADRGVLNVQFDLTEELKRMANIPAESPNWVGIHTGVIHDNLIYFLADINYLGIFDPSQKKIIWWHKFQFEIKSTMLKNGTESFCVTNNKIYVLDNSNTLHIFEKENQN